MDDQLRWIHQISYKLNKFQPQVKKQGLKRKSNCNHP
jgi:hypothetical protein